LWLAPQQVVIASIVSEVNDYAIKVQNLLKEKGIRAEADLRNEKISYKVREHSSRKVPIILAIGKNEQSNETVSLRRIGSKDSEVIDLNEAIKKISKENSSLS
jgi:threonyl-tRNA synthetase